MRPETDTLTAIISAMLIYCKEFCKVYATPLEVPSDINHKPSLDAQRQAVRFLLAEAFPQSTPTLKHFPSGAPFLEGASNRWSISVTHCRHMVAIAICDSPRRIGIDVEAASRGNQLRRVAPRFLTPAQSTGWGVSDDLLLLAWSIKEAVYKAAGIQGLPLQEIPLPEPPLPKSSNLGNIMLDNVPYDLTILPGTSGCGSIVLVQETNRMNTHEKNDAAYMHIP